MGGSLSIPTVHPCGLWCGGCGWLKPQTHHEPKRQTLPEGIFPIPDVQHSQQSTPQIHNKSWHSGILLHSAWVEGHTGGSRSVPTVHTPEEAVGSSQAPQPDKPNTHKSHAHDNKRPTYHSATRLVSRHTSHIVHEEIGTTSNTGLSETSHVQFAAVNTLHTSLENCFTSWMFMSCSTFNSKSGSQTGLTCIFEEYVSKS